MVSLVPQPKRVVTRPGAFSDWRSAYIHIGTEAAAEGEILSADVQARLGIKLPTRVIPSLGPSCVICSPRQFADLSGAASGQAAARADRSAPGGAHAEPAGGPAGPGARRSTSNDSYRLTVSQKGIVIEAADQDGLYWGTRTLLQMAEDSPEVSSVFVEDEPDLAVRGVHLDLKGGVPTFEYLLSVLDGLSAIKINTVMVEYEDKVRYGKHPKIAAPSALSQDEIRRFVEHARRRHIQVMPLLQCLGHVEYILKHPEYESVRESADHLQQWCPSNPATDRLFRELADELLDLHPDSRYFHIGGDEARQLGECPACAKRVAEMGKHRFYLEFVKKVCEYVLERGRIPVMWDDMITRHEPDLINELPSEVILMYWNYSITTSARPFLAAQGGWAYSREWTKKQYEGARGLPTTGKGKTRVLIEDLPPETQELYREHSKGTDYPRQINTTLFMEVIHDYGRAFMGAPGVQTGSHKVLSNPEGCYPNIRLFAQEARRNGAEGIVATGWTRNGSLREPNGIIPGMWPGFYAAAEYAWWGDGVDFRELDRKLNKRLFGIDGWDATDAIWLIRHLSHVPSGEDLHDWFQALAERATRNVDLLRYYAVMADLFLVENELSTFTGKSERYYYARKRGFLTERERNHYRAELAVVKSTLDRAEGEMRAAYAQYLPSVEVEDCVDSFFDWRRKLVAFHESVICPTSEE